MTRSKFFSLSVRPLFLLAAFLSVGCAVCLAGPGGGGVGYPNTMIFDFWQGRANPNNVIVGDSSATQKTMTFNDGAAANIRGGTNQDIHIKQQGTNKQIIDFTTGNGAGASAVRLSITSDGITENGTPLTSTADTLIDAPPGSQIRERNNGADVWQIQSTGVLTASGKTFFANGPFTLGAGGSQLTSFPFFLGGHVGAAVTANTKDFSVFSMPANGAFTPVALYFTIDVAGAVGGTCTYAFRDATTATTLCTVSLSCTNVAIDGTEHTATCSGTVNASDIVDLRVVAPAGDTAAIGDWQVIGHY